MTKTMEQLVDQTISLHLVVLLVELTNNDRQDYLQCSTNKMYEHCTLILEIKTKVFIMEHNKVLGTSPTGFACDGGSGSYIDGRE